MPSAKYETYCGAAAYNRNNNYAAMMTNGDQHPLLQEQQTYFHDNSGLFRKR
ncbi:hypothetical protein T11_8073 [Trichinella zimbabwensis]|uniref:Uncharacterized protein n=1 Tax=Trichinella zimbabwensis TaxID=268475 RepID=A0A0V1EET9_9BILA|nr:hypothetical protein T11_8073 [Trichinella zimbabwensis]